MGKSKNAVSCRREVQKAKKPLDLVYMDITVCSSADHQDRSDMLGLVDSCTNMSWMFPLDSKSTKCVTDALE